MEVVEELEASLIPDFESICQNLANKYNEYKFRVFSNSGGDATPHPWHVFGVECMLHENWEDQPNTVSLHVDALSLKTTPEIWAGVVWEYSKEPAEYSLFQHPVLFSEKTLEVIKRALPDLVGSLENAIKKWEAKSKNNSLLDNAA